MKYIFLLCTVVFAFACENNNIPEENENSWETGGIKGNHELILSEDTTSLLRNPCMGWGLYDDAPAEVAEASSYWATQDYAARQYASYFYIRWRWSEMEPEEGKYVWLYDDNYKHLIQGALDRGLKLHFCIYDNSQDNIEPATPDFVREAGCEGYTVDIRGRTGETIWTPYPDDPVFRQKYANFVAAFAKEYDDPDRVDIIDGFNLGWWGESHHIVLKDMSKLEDTFQWFTDLYSSHFKRIILDMPFNNEVGFETEKRLVYDSKTYAMRRNGLGSMWFNDIEQEWATDMFGEVLLVGEQCYWGPNINDIANDTRFPEMSTWRDAFEAAYSDAINYHFNTLDLRNPYETQKWLGQATDLVQRFMIKGGYRLSITKISLPEQLQSGQEAEIEVIWKNTGNGYLPNNMKNWNYKYKPAYALITNEGKVVKTWIDNDAEPSDWIDSNNYSYRLSVFADGIEPGEYQWGVAIVDKTKNNIPGINLAIKDKTVINGWVLLAPVTVNL